ncbi:dipeptide ABC transporter ATP-binding protein [Afipia felis]|uniref:Glutathione import ATP-binding protein GsiA n=2 Tax=Afipia felis TaxID=1035 RepID=A0A380W285_AFIFE|nr:ABC transporter ATP-binding protein [Afipia felis]EKS30159.1 oligopeptide/dipeptide ABC transporter [Afipia felis ATCC 53690]SUU74904.1 Glutathione import ATP-binding protein GsiA [Afipia felis]SUU82970.1 Glutathione import ATP-binding protein GsiA [Afipia felis]
MTSDRPLLEVRNLSVTLPVGERKLHVVRDVSFTLERGEALGVVGESGSGKSMTSLALMNLLPRNAIREAATLRLGEHDLLAMDRQDFSRSLAGKRMAMIFQEPMTSLNPVYTIGQQIMEMTTPSSAKSAKDIRDRAVYLLERIGIPDAAGRLKQYPHELSGGLRQRVMIAMMLMNEPDLLIADEPTTALDVTVQASILKLLMELRKELGMALILVSHDLGVVSQSMDKIAVMYAGELVETGAVADVLGAPQHPYTQGLLASIPAARDGGERLPSIPGTVPALFAQPKGCVFAPRCIHVQPECRASHPPEQSADDDHLYRCVMTPDSGRVALDRPPAARATVSTAASNALLSARNVGCTFTIRTGLLAKSKTLTAVDNVSLDLAEGEIVALVGESGSGKSTLARILLGLQAPDKGEVLIAGTPVQSVPPFERAKLVQPVFQDPYSSLNPRKTIGQSIGRPLELHGQQSAAERKKIVEQTMELVGLPKRLLNNYPSQLSGGQRQRVAIARAIILKPKLLICDEPTSALDVSVQAQILNLLLDLRDELGLSYLLITHDLAVVDCVATRIAVMHRGRIVELGSKDDVLSAPGHPYTRTLLGSVLKIDMPALKDRADRAPGQQDHTSLLR